MDVWNGWKQVWMLHHVPSSHSDSNVGDSFYIKCIYVLISNSGFQTGPPPDDVILCHFDDVVGGPVLKSEIPKFKRKRR